ncbi:MAG: hypothetical protein MJ003_06420 [Paludibacteraceae bacterium]|nr:hypothetical protein [Paludibacteraceae bacterium]
MSINVIDSPIAGHRYAYLSVPNNTRWGELQYRCKEWAENMRLNGSINVDCEDASSMIELDNLVRTMRESVVMFGGLLCALPANFLVPNGEEFKIWWISISYQSNFDKILVIHGHPGGITSYTHFMGERQALILARIIQLIFRVYGIEIPIECKER